MDHKTKLTLKNAIVSSLHYLHELEGKFSETEQYLAWNKTSWGGWEGKLQQKIDLVKLYYQADRYINEIGKEFCAQFLNEYPQYNQLVGLDKLGQFSFDPLTILKNASLYLRNKYQTFDCSDALVDELVQECEEFLDKPTVRLRFQVQLINYGMNQPILELPKNLRIRQLSDEEVTSFHGGSLIRLKMTPRRSPSISGFVIEGEYEAKKIFGDYSADFRADSNEVKSRLDSAILALRTFKSGPVGYDQIHYEPIKFCPINTFSLFDGDEYIPFGIYQINSSENEGLYKHAALILDISEPAMKTACYRLANAEIRTRAEDQILDAIIGMEALLLASLDEKGELSYRFSIHYASLFDSLEKKAGSLRLAKDLYKLRSKIAHGSDLKDKLSLGGKNVTHSEAAKQAIEALRDLIHQLLPESKEAPYKKNEFWEKKLGLRN